MRIAVTFVVPTTGRASLRAALRSLTEQESESWRCVVVGDGITPQDDPEIAHYAGDSRFVMLTAPMSGSAGLARNAALRAMREKRHPQVRRISQQTRYVAFLDDDDEIGPNYVGDTLAFDQADVVIHRMLHEQLGVLPDPIEPKLIWGGVGVSFAVRWGSRFSQVDFIREEHPDDPDHAVNEDIAYLRELMRLQARVGLVPHVNYFVRGFSRERR